MANNRQIEEAAPCWNIRDIGHPQPIGLIRGEIAFNEIGHVARPIPHGRDGALATAHADQTSVQHQLGNPFATDTNPQESVVDQIPHSSRPGSSSLLGRRLGCS
jgi:hypothetical protein